jgi:hypothetical protein
MFKSGNFYLCVKKTNKSENEEINSFIYAVFGNKKYEYGRNNRFNYSDNTFGEFYEGHIYLCPVNNALKDEKENIIFLNQSRADNFEEIKVDFSDVKPLLEKLNTYNRGTAYIKPSLKLGNMILYDCRVSIYGTKHSGLGEALAENKVKGLMLAYREARKNLLTKTKLFKSLYSYEI